MKAPQNSEPVAVSKAYDFTLWMMPKVENFPRAYGLNAGPLTFTAGGGLRTTTSAWCEIHD